MADVRLTATNPEDSSVVPVACNAKGELKLEELPTFDGNVDGNLTVAGSATVAGEVEAQEVDAIKRGTDGVGSMSGTVKFGVHDINGDFQVTHGVIQTYGSGVTGPGGTGGDLSFSTKQTYADGGEMQEVFRLYWNSSASFVSGCTFAGNKAGITDEGFLWCTTRRGDTVILDATSQGLGSWVSYEPPTRRDVLSKESSQDTGKTPQ